MRVQREDLLAGDQAGGRGAVPGCALAGDALLVVAPARVVPVRVGFVGSMISVTDSGEMVTPVSPSPS
jgi:hypothetical protein